MGRDALSHEFYDRIKPRPYRQIGRVLDLDCGACGLVKYLAQAYGQHVTGFDISSPDFPKQPGSSRNARIRCIRKDAARLDFAADKSVDAVVVLWALHEMKHARTILGKAKRVLSSGGEILIVEFPRDSLAQGLWGADYYSPEELATMLDNAGYQETTVRLIERRWVIWARGFRPERPRKQGAAS